MQTYEPLSAPWRLAASMAAILASAIVLVSAMLPFGLDSPERGEAILARETALQAMRVGAASVPTGRAASSVERSQHAPLHAAKNELESD